MSIDSKAIQKNWPITVIKTVQIVAMRATNIYQEEMEKVPQYPIKYKEKQILFQIQFNDRLIAPQVLS